MRAAESHKRVSVRSGHKVSKSCSAGCLAWWWCHRWPDGRVVMTATTNNQIRGILWREMKALRRRALIDLPQPAELPAIGIQWDDGRSITGFSTSDAEKMAGISGAHLLFIVDEASGVTEDIWEAIEGNRAGGAHVVAFSNPTQPTGTFYDSFHTKSRFWKNIHVSSWEAAETGIPGLATKEWCQEKLLEWGADSPLYQVRVMGNFPAHSSEAVIPLYLVEAARAAEVAPEGDLRLGVDPARFGDDESTIAAVRGKHLFPVVYRQGQDTVRVAKLVLDEVRKYHIKGEARPQVTIDTVGIGAGVADICRDRYSEEMDIREHSGAAKAAEEEEYVNQRTEAWFHMAEWLVGADIPENDDKLHMDMLAPQYDFDAKNRRRLEEKRHIKVRLGRSPDRGDAVAMAVYNPDPPLVYPVSDGAKMAGVRIELDTRWAGMPLRGY